MAAQGQAIMPSTTDEGYGIAYYPPTGNDMGDLLCGLCVGTYARTSSPQATIRSRAIHYPTGALYCDFCGTAIEGS